MISAKSFLSIGVCKCIRPTSESDMVSLLLISVECHYCRGPLAGFLSWVNGCFRGHTDFLVWSRKGPVILNAPYLDSSGSRLFLTAFLSSHEKCRDCKRYRIVWAHF